MIKVAKGEEKAELVLKNAKVVNVFTNEIITGDVAIYKGEIVGIGEYSGINEIDIKGMYVAPGFIDSHVHIESSKVTPPQFARAVVPRGVTTVIADPHEIANVKGVEGIKYMLKSSENIPLDVFIVLPSCVPATPFENSGAILDAEDLEELIDSDRILGLGEMMDYVGVLHQSEKVLEKLYMTRLKGKIIDGHGPMISGKELNAYVVSGIATEHECSTTKEVLERLRLGMYIQVREGTVAKNLKEILKIANKNNLRRLLFCTDDKEIYDLMESGSIDNNIRLAIKEGVDPIDAIKMATLNAAEAYNLRKRGAVAPGYKADLVIIDDLENLNIVKVFKNGRLVAENYKPLFEVPYYDDVNMKNTVNIGDITKEDLKIRIHGENVHVIKIIPNSLITEKSVKKVGKDIITRNGEFISGDDIVKMAVIERHKKSGNIGVGLVEGFGLKNGAIASTVAHDSHNLIVIGDSDEDMLLAIEELKRVGGGITLTSGREILGTLPLEIGGLMTDRNIEKVYEHLNRLLKIAYDKLKINPDIEPFMALSFMALPVIPKLRITDMGLFDVERFEFINIFS
ncbi:adenine deaminase [Caldanaerobacter subterraneus]|uniref:Adenine deaminase n=2 Tax=Caldanaerobacter subterraneus TaxID=911092 RepID=A0A7Y2PLA7_9THEO|nr:adenine deaminase [Caldanaerobacter subterraneus]NNG65918.1 adenine deaminase [Caldanaerobacter subterraneus]